MAEYFTPPGTERIIPSNVNGVVPFKRRIDVANGTTGASSTPTGPLTTVGNIINILKFPRNATLVNIHEWYAQFIGQLDTHASLPTAVVELQVSANEDGSSGTTLLGAILEPDSTGSGDETALTVPAVPAELDLSEKWLQLKVATAPALGDASDVFVEVRGYYERGTIRRDNDVADATGVTI
jgi:hypothetical protein